MEIKKKSRVKEFFKKFGGYIAGIVLVLALTTTGLVLGLTGGHKVPDDVDVSTSDLKFGLPMTSPEILKDFSALELQENTTLNQWEAHLSIDMTSADGFVYSVLDGTVLDVAYNYMEGHIVKIQHEGGFVSIYSSLGKDLLVSKGDKVTTGQKIGVAGATASAEEADGDHLHFTLTKDDKKVDPNLYIELQNK